jgi:hypothetical protein
MRLLRDAIPGVGSRYISFPADQLVAVLKRYSPLTQVFEDESRGKKQPPAAEEDARKAKTARTRGKKGRRDAPPLP